MKWLVAGAGALLSVAGGYALFNGASIIQVERGWATFIAGAVLLGAGVIVLAIAALMGRIDSLADSLYDNFAPAGEWQDEAPATVEAAPDTSRSQQTFVQPIPEPVAAEPVARREAMAYAPEPAPEPAPYRETPAPAFTPAAVQASEQRGPALRDFKFVFPPAEAVAEPAPAPAPELAPVLAAVAPVEAEKPASKGALTWLRRGKATPEQTPEPLSLRLPERKPEPLPERIPEMAPEPEPALRAEEPVEATTYAAERYDERTDVVAERYIFETVPTPEPVVETQTETQAETAPAPEPDPFSNDWLERALAGADEPRETRATPPALRRTAVLEERVQEQPVNEEQAAAQIVQDEPAPESHEPAPQHEQILEAVAHEAAPEQEAAPVLAAAPEPEPAAGGITPVEIGRYRANDVAYVMFADGSITAETPAGASYRFNSLVELRAFIERGGAA